MRKNSRVKTGCYYIPYHCQNDPCQREIIAMYSSPQNSVAWVCLCYILAMNTLDNTPTFKT